MSDTDKIYSALEMKIDSILFMCAIKCSDKGLYFPAEISEIIKQTLTENLLQITTESTVNLKELQGSIPDNLDKMSEQSLKNILGILYQKAEEYSKTSTEFSQETRTVSMQRTLVALKLD